MSYIKAHANRCKNELDASAKELDDLNKLYDEMSVAFQKQGAEVTQGDLDAINSKIEAKKTEFSQHTKDLETALTALDAEKKVEEELRQALNKDNDPKLGMKPGKSLDDFGKKDDELER
jgi:chromosome segregation ATPase